MDLAEFLVKAKKATYASDGEGNETQLPDGTRELIYEENGYKYRDRYFGFNPFGGEEVVWYGGEVVWIMNYYGKTTTKDVPPKNIYEFLKKAMSQVTLDKPYRGPDTFNDGDFQYMDKSRGDTNEFHGKEMIHYRGHEVYWLKYHGGLVKKKA
jgi:hypothetical protein